MTTPIRHIKLSTGHVLTLYDTGRTIAGGKVRLGYEFTAPRIGVIDHDLVPPLFEGEDFGASPLHALDSDATVLALLSFLTLRPGDTDSEYFERYTDAQREWSESSACEMLAADVSIAEEQSQGECACILWENLDGHVCETAGNVAGFEVLDHGEDGSQYFPGCGVAFSKFEHVATGVGDTGKEALDDALESMAQNDARMSKMQEVQAIEYLTEPNKSAFDSLDHSECVGEGAHEGDDWHHYVSIRYNVRKES